VCEGIREGKLLQGEAGKVLIESQARAAVETSPKFIGKSETPEESSFRRPEAALKPLPESTIPLGGVRQAARRRSTDWAVRPEGASAVVIGPGLEV
jgi:hypothetical protein